MKSAKKKKMIYRVVVAILSLVAAFYYFKSEKTPAEQVKCVKNEDCELYQCANCANKNNIKSSERGNDGCRADLKIGCGCVKGVCQREYK